VILFLGALGYEPNQFAVEWLCESIFPKIRRLIPEAKLWLVGRDPPKHLQSFISLGIELIRNVPDVRPYPRGSSVLVVPVTTGGGTRIKILEAAAAGRPVVSTSLGAEGLNFIPGVEIEIADSEDEFVRKTLGLLSNRAKAEKMAKLARLRVEGEHTWEMSKRKLEAVISPWL
jgi:glycosyltransferase involved in cell wall biosynthesis